MKLVLITSAICFFLQNLINAQPAFEEPIIPQSVRATTLEERPLSETLYYLDTNMAYQPFDIGQKRRGQTNVQPLGNKLVLHRKGVNEEGNVIYNPIINVSIPKVDNVLVVFYWDKNEKIGYTAPDDTKETHPSQFARIVNMTDSGVAVQVSNNTGVITVSPNQNVVAPNPVITDSNYFNFAYKLISQAGSQSRPPINRWRLSSEEQRCLVFFTYGFDTEEINGELIHTRVPQLVTMYDFPPEPPANI